jgi:hypothetical protein
LIYGCFKGDCEAVSYWFDFAGDFTADEGFSTLAYDFYLFYDGAAFTVYFFGVETFSCNFKLTRTESPLLNILT